MKNRKQTSLYHGDCLQVLRDLAIKSIKFDAVLTDPPYGIMIGMGTNSGKDKSGRPVLVRKHEWDTALPILEMFDLISAVSKPKANVFLFAQEPFTSKLIMFRHPRVK